MDNAAKAPQIIKAVLLRTLVNIIGAKDEAAKLTVPWIIAWCLGSINVFDLSEANCQKRTIIYYKAMSKEVIFYTSRNVSA